MAKQLFSGWASIFEDFAFPPQVTAGLIAAWFTSLKWPMALNSPMLDLNKAISDFLRMFRYETMDTATKSLLISTGCWLYAHSSGCLLGTRMRWMHAMPSCWLAGNRLFIQKQRRGY